MRIKPTVDVSSSGTSPPLVKPDRRFSRIRLSVVVHRTRCRDRPLRGATQCPLPRASLSCRCYLPCGSHRTVRRCAVHVDQVRSLRSSPVTGLHRYYEPLRLLPRPNGPHGFAACARCWASPPTGGDLIPCPNHPSGHSTPADPAAVMTGHRVVQASPVQHRVCFGPVLTAFAICGAARLCGVCAYGAHSMGLTFVADCSFGLRLLSTRPRGHAVAAPSRLNDLIGRMRLSLMVGWFSESHPQISLITRMKARIRPSPSICAICEIRGCDHEVNYHNSESLFDRIKRFAVEGIGHGCVPRGATGKHDRSPDRPAAMKMNPIE
jgi:mRNA-degrading endonuclease toxin of MazEF toxin-antitoxin module